MTDYTQENGGFMNVVKETSGTNVMAQGQESKMIQEVQAAMTVAKKFPRNQLQAYQDIMTSCKRKSLADQALYAYKKGSTLVSGPSIRLAEVLAQNWGNIDFGFRVLHQDDKFSTIESYAWDLQTNTRSTKIFNVPHEMKAHGSIKKLSDPRDIYELSANMAARRTRACILAVIPGDLVESAVEACEKTMADTGGIPKAERLKTLINAFNEVDVKVEHIEKRLGHKIDATSESELVELRKIFKSIRDGFAGREDFFDFGQAGQVTEGEGGLKDLAKNKAKPNVAPAVNAPVDKETGEIHDKK